MIINTEEFAYNKFGYIVTSPTAPVCVGPRRIFCSFITTFAGFLYNLKCKRGYAYGAATQVFYDRVGTRLQLSCQSFSPDRLDVRMASRIAPSAVMEANRYMSFAVKY